MNPLQSPPKGEVAPAAASIVSLVTDWVSMTNARVRMTTELALAEAKLAAISIALMVFLAMLAAAFVLGAWGLMVAGLVYALVHMTAPLWLVLIALCIVHGILARLFWNHAVRLSRHLEFPVTRQQFTAAPEECAHVERAETTRG